MIDPLERRTLLSSSLNPTTGILFVDGTAGNDVITFQKVTTSKGPRLNVSINSATEGFNIKKITAIRVSAGDGNDTVTIGSLGIKTTVDGGAGDDALTGGDQQDKLFGGDGNDSMFGAAAGGTSSPSAMEVLASKVANRARALIASTAATETMSLFPTTRSARTTS